MNKEELAFKNIEELSQEDELILYDIIDFLQKDRKQWINQFSKTHNENVELQQKVNHLELDVDSYKSKYKRANELYLDICKEVNQLETNRDVLKEYIQNLIYNIEPEGVRINFNCEYDSEEDYIRGMEQKSRLETLKEVLSKIEILERGKE